MRVFPWFLLAGLLVACASTATDDRPAPGGGRVERVVDGDTLKVRLDGGGRATVRLIGVDTPESVKPDSPVECFGREAAAFARRLLAGRRVRLVQDAEPRDRFGRLLAYVYADGRMANLEIVRGGYAEPLTIPPNVRFAARFRAAAAEARRARRGLWRRC